MQWRLEQKKLPLKFTWKISRGASNEKEIYYVTLKDYLNGEDEIFYGEASFITKNHPSNNYHELFNNFINSLQTESLNITQLNSALLKSKLPTPLRFAINSAYTHWLAQAAKQKVSHFLKLEDIPAVKTSFSIPILDTCEVGPYVEQYNLHRFHSLKLKVCKETAFENFLELTRHYTGRIRIDGNEGWDSPDDLLLFIEKIKKHHARIEFVEQPLKVELRTEHLYLKERSPLYLMADESIVDQDVTLYHQARFHGVNIKLMKSGSYQQALRQIRQARQLGLKVMLGCMVESGLGIFSAMQIAKGVDYFDLDGFLLLANDPFSHLVDEGNGVVSLKEKR